jgi:hypothetical protein
MYAGVSARSGVLQLYDPLFIFKVIRIILALLVRILGRDWTSEGMKMCLPDPKVKNLN